MTFRTSGRSNLVTLPGRKSPVRLLAALSDHGSGMGRNRTPVGRPVFKTGERRQTSLVGSTPTLFRHQGPATSTMVMPPLPPSIPTNLRTGTR